MPMVELRGLSALEAWTKKVTHGYKDVRVHDLSTSWRDGLAFCALIHHFRPDLIDFDSLSKENILYNNRLAFQVAEKHLGVPALLDAEDMFKHEEPDRLSVATYLSQFYECFEGSKSDRKPSITKSSPKPITTSSTTSNTTTAGSSDTTGANNANNNHPIPPKRDTKCQKCRTRVYVLERVFVDDLCYHKSCLDSITTDDIIARQSEDNNNTEESRVDKSVDSRIGVTSDDPNVGSDANRTNTDSESVVKTMTTKPQIPAKTFRLMPSSVEPSPKSSSDVTKQEVPSDVEVKSAAKAEVEVKSVANSVANKSPDSTETYEKSVDSSAVDDMFNKVFGKSVRISDQISEIEVDDQDVEEEDEVEEEEDKPEEEVTMEDIEDAETSEEISKDIYPDDKNPFDDEEEEDNEEDNETKEDNSENLNKKDYPDEKNPFGDEEEEEETKSSVHIRLRTPSDALNPFADEDDDEEVAKHEINVTPKPKPRQSLVVTSSPSSAVSSPTSSLRSRKKRPAPTPPTATNTPTSIPQVNSSCSLNSSLVMSGESSRRDSIVSELSSDLCSSVPNSRTPTPLPRHRVQRSADELSDSTADTHERSRHKSDMNSSIKSNDSDSDVKPTSASDLRPVKKRPAPPIPAVKRIIKGSLAEIECELNSIGDRLPVIESRSKELEESLLKCQQNPESKSEAKEVSAEEAKSSSSEPTAESKPKNEELMNQFLSNARERCRLARRQKELMYMKREHKLEEIQADIEYQMRCVISKQDAQKTDEDKKNEEELLKRLVEIIEERNDIVENMIRDENREVEEYRKLVSRVMPNSEVNANEIAIKSEPKISKHKSIDKNLVRLKDKLKLKDIKRDKEKKKLKKLKESDKSSDKSEAIGSQEEKTCPESHSKPSKNSSKHLSLKSTLKPLKKSLGLKSSDKKSDRNNTSLDANNDSKPKQTNDCNK